MIGLDLDLTNALMGHSQYLDGAYLRLDTNEDAAQAYLEAIPNVSVYAVESADLKEATEALALLEAENAELKEKYAELKAASEASLGRWEAERDALHARLQRIEQVLVRLETERGL
jgi:hypothetical protein